MGLSRIIFGLVLLSAISSSGNIDLGTNTNLILIILIILIISECCCDSSRGFGVLPFNDFGRCCCNSCGGVGFGTNAFNNCYGYNSFNRNAFNGPCNTCSGCNGKLF